MPMDFSFLGAILVKWQPTSLRFLRSAGRAKGLGNEGDLLASCLRGQRWQGQMCKSKGVKAFTHMLRFHLRQRKGLVSAFVGFGKVPVLKRGKCSPSMILVHHVDISSSPHCMIRLPEDPCWKQYYHSCNSQEVNLLALASLLFIQASAVFFGQKE